MNLAQATWTAGTQFGRYRILGRLARGGMAEVWRAAVAGDPGLRRQVAIKTMRPELAVSADLVRMFMNEASIARRMNHPGIMQVLDSGKLDERTFMVIEYVPGLSLRQLGREFRDRGLRLPRRFVLRVVAGVARALAYGHGLQENGRPVGFVHRDVSPENIMVASNGLTKLIDFGAAMTYACPPASRTFVGKFRYLAPERLRGEDGDPRTDIYALGVVLYEYLTGRRPYDGTKVKDLIASGGAPDPCRLVPGLPARAGAVVLRAMAVDAYARYQDAGQLADDLATLLDSRLGSDPAAATVAQVAQLLRSHEQQALEGRDATAKQQGSEPGRVSPAASAPGPTLPGPRRATLSFGIATPGGGPPAPGGESGGGQRPRQTPAENGIQRTRGISVAVVVNDPGESDEASELDGGFQFGVDADIDAHLHYPPAAEDDDEAVETSLFMGRDLAAASGKISRANQASRHEREGSDRAQGPKANLQALLGKRDRLNVGAAAPTKPDPAAVVRRSLPELHGGTGWFGPTPVEAPAAAANGSPAASAPTGDKGGVAPAGGAPAAIRSVSAAACFERGLQLIAKRDFAAALVQWRRASALEPDRNWYRANLERLARRMELQGGHNPE